MSTIRLQNGFANVNGTSLYYETAGMGHPLILIHGFSHCTRLWDEQFSVFSRKFRVVRYDVRGFGYSATPQKNEYCHSGDLKALLDFLEIARASILGLSMGGGIAIDFAISYPAVMQSLITVDSVLSGFPVSKEWLESWERTFTILGPLYKNRQLNKVLDYWFQHPILQPALEKYGLRSKLIQITAGYSGWHYLNNDPVRDIDPPATMRLIEIRVPTLILVGQRDLQHYHLVAEALKNGIGKSRKVMLAGVGHLPPLECPRKFNNLVVSFLREVDNNHLNSV